MTPKPRVNLTRFHGVFAPNSKYRVTITPAKRGKGANPKQASLDGEEKSPMEQRTASKELDIQARTILSKELGHDRGEILVSYIGSSK